MTGRLAHPSKLAAQARYWRARGRDDVAERLEAQLVAFGRCRICGRALSDPVSVERSIGPECAAKERQPMIEPHRVVWRSQPAGYQRAHTSGSRAWCAKPGCRWTWDGIGGGFDHVKAEHEKLNNAAKEEPRDHV